LEVLSWSLDDEGIRRVWLEEDLKFSGGGRTDEDAADGLA
jgi:hypothetical protein